VAELIAAAHYLKFASSNTGGGESGEKLPGKIDIMPLISASAFLFRFGKFCCVSLANEIVCRQSNGLRMTLICDSCETH